MTPPRVFVKHESVAELLADVLRCQYSYFCTSKARKLHTCLAKSARDAEPSGTRKKKKAVPQVSAFVLLY